MKIKNVPTKIYLQVSDDIEEGDEINFDDLAEVTWSRDRVHSTDLEFTLTDFQRGWNEVQKSE